MKEEEVATYLDDLHVGERQSAGGQRHARVPGPALNRRMIVRIALVGRVPNHVYLI